MPLCKNKSIQYKRKEKKQNNQYCYYNTSQDKNGFLDCIATISTCLRQSAKVSCKWGLNGLRIFSNKLLLWPLCTEDSTCFSNRRSLSAHTRQQIACINMHRAQQRKNGNVNYLLRKMLPWCSH